MARRKRLPVDPEKAVAYLRRSKDESRQRYSFDVQKKAIADWAATNEVEIVETFFDDDVGGGVQLEKRPGLLAAIEYVRNHGVGKLVLWKRDRLARDVLTSATVDMLVEKEGATVCATDASNGTDENSLLLRGLMDLLAQHERHLIRSRTKAALDVKKTRGERTGNIPWGYQLAKDGVHLEPNAAEQEVAEAAKRLREAGWSYRGVVAELIRLGYRSRKGRPLGLRQVQQLIES